MGTFFFVKRLVGIVVQPLPVVFSLAALGLLLLLFTKRKKGAAAFLALSALVLFAASFPPSVRWQAGLLERRHKPLLTRDANAPAPWAVVVLGNGVAHPDDAFLPAIARLNDCARARLVEGVRLARLFPEARLVTCGYGMGLENCADAMAEAAAELGVDSERLVRLAQSVDTAHEARLVRELAGERQIVLVTSAAHMPRAMTDFLAEGVRAVPAPCDFIAPRADASLAAVNRWRWRPRGGSLADSEELWHEFLGLAYQRFWQKRTGGAHAGHE